MTTISENTNMKIDKNDWKTEEKKMNGNETGSMKNGQKEKKNQKT